MVSPHLDVGGDTIWEGEAFTRQAFTPPLDAARARAAAYPTPLPASVYFHDWAEDCPSYPADPSRDCHNTTRRNNTTQNNTTRRNTTQHSATQHNTTQHNTTQHNITQHNTTQRNAPQHNTTQHNTTHHDTTHHNTTQPNLT